MHATLKAVFLAILCAAVGLVLFGGRVSPPPLASIHMPITPAAPKPPVGPDEAVREFLSCLHDNRPDVLWNALPASYQRDLTEVVHEFAAQVPAEVWNGAISILRKGPPLVQAAKNQLARLANSENGKERRADVETLAAVSDAGGAVFDALLAGRLADQKFVQTAELKEVVRPILAQMVHDAGTVVSRLPADSPAAWLKDIHQLRVELLNVNGDEATIRCGQSPGPDQTVDIHLVRVEGKWIPKEVAEGWSALIAECRKEIQEFEWTAESLKDVRQSMMIYDFYFIMATSTLQSEFFRLEDAFDSSGALDVTGFPSNAVLMLGYLFGGPPMIEADFYQQTEQKLQGKKKTTLVMCYAPTELKWDNDAVDYELAKHVADRLNENDIHVVDPDRARAWLEQNKDWHKAAEVGAEFKVDYVLMIDLKDYSLFEEHSSDQYRGRADAMFTVIKMDDDKKDGTVIYSKEIVSRFPTRAPVSVYKQSYENFKKLYLQTLSQQIGKLFYETENGNDVPDSPLNE